MVGVRTYQLFLPHNHCISFY